MTPSGGRGMVNGELERLCVNTIRFLSVDAVQKAKSGHPGLPLGAAPMAYVLWSRFLKHNPANPRWPDRDRFVLSAGHGSMLLYSLLFLTGYDLPLEEIRHFRQWNSHTPGHPERGVAPGVEVTTGPLGQGFANGVGMAIAEANLAARFNRPGLEVVSHFTYALVSDGDIMEGVASEAASLAGHLRLGKLIYLYDDNRVSLSAGTNISMSEDVAGRFRAYGWNVLNVADGNDLAEIGRALSLARAEAAQPTLIIVRTHIGYGSPNMQDTFEAHGAPLGEEEVRLTKRALGWPETSDFLVPEEALRHMRQARETGATAESEWQARMERYRAQFPAEARELETMLAGRLPDGWDADIPTFPADAKGEKTRVAGGKVLGAIAKRMPAIVGGSGDLDPSTFTMLKGLGDFEDPRAAFGDVQGSAGGGWNRAGRNIHFGVREHAMGAISNGIAAHGGLLPFAATFLIFSDYMRPPIRLASIMELHVIYVFTHDSIGLGEDGPTHQPVEQLANLRAIPNLTVIRPCDANEAAVAWRVAVELQNRPVALILSRQDVPTLERSQLAPAERLRQGGYVLAEAPGGRPDMILIATGSEVHLALAARNLLERERVKARVVSLPSWELFEAQPEAYRNEVLPPELRTRLAIEAASPFGWERYVGDSGGVISIDHFGASAPAATLFREYGFTPENIARQALDLLARTRGKM